MSLRLPNFESESEEAEWWHEHRAEVEADFIVAAAAGRLQRRSHSGEFTKVQPLNLPDEDLKEARELLDRSGIWVDDGRAGGVEEAWQTTSLLRAG